MHRGSQDGSIMTLVIATLAPDWVAIAADRVLSLNGEAHKKTAIKLVAFYNDLVFGYTGYASLPNADGRLIETDIWLADVLSTVRTRSIPEALLAVRNRATAAFARIKAAGFKVIGHAFLGVGWDKDAFGTPSTPKRMMFRITNCHDVNGRYLRIPRLEFAMNSVTLPDNQGISETVGCLQNDREQRWFRQRMEKAALRGNPMTFVHLMKQSIRQTSIRLKGKLVGQDVLAAVVPISATLSEHVIVMGPRAEHAVTFCTTKEHPIPDYQQASFFMRFPAGNDSGIYEAPHLMCPGLYGPRLWISGREGLQPHGAVNKGEISLTVGESMVEGKMLYDKYGFSIGLTNIKARRSDTNDPKRRKRKKP
jgi:hypothetical protein